MSLIMVMSLPTWMDRLGACPGAPHQSRPPSSGPRRTGRRSGAEPSECGAPYPGGKDGYIDAAKFREVFAADLPARQTRLMAATQRPGSVGGLSGHSGAPAWKSVPSWFVIPTADNVIPPAVQRFMAKRAGGKIKEVAGASHVVMMSRTGTVVRQILAAYAATR
ncbi:alpha/beta fold hydrolase [Nonomuraea angiospora]|uniref:alpha/beta fold hydrolase n=1 Tax=Nonomuraea angiospora TaxID=46172 RepID=UPI0034268372